MREIVGFIAVQGVMAFAGVGVLRALGLVTLKPSAVAMALGAAIVTGTCAVVVAVVALVVIGVPLTLFTATLVAVALAALGFGLGHRRAERGGEAPAGWIALVQGGMIAAAAAYAAVGAHSLASLSTVEDDARIWSLKGVTLTYYDDLRREIFVNPATVRSHHVYPLFQPVLEALVNRAMGRLELRLFHAELWLLLIAVAWTAAYLIWWRCRRPLIEQIGLVALAVLVTTPFVIESVATGYADITGGMLLGVGALTLALWLDGAGDGHLWLGALLLGTAANTKDEDAVGAVLVLLVLGVAIVVRGDRSRLRLWLAGAASYAALIAPWRVWTAVHGLSDSVEPALPRSLSPAVIVDRFSRLHRTAQAMVSTVLGLWGWQLSIFLALCIVAIAAGTARRLAGFYLLSVAALMVSLLWLYTTTSVDLGFLITTSVARTTDVFMMLTPFASAHLLTKLARAGQLGLGSLAGRSPAQRASSSS